MNKLSEIQIQLNMKQLQNVLLNEIDNFKFEVKKKDIEEICKSQDSLKIKNAFINACILGKLADVIYILKNFIVDPNIGIIPACRSCNIEIVDYLLNLGADPNYIDKNQKNLTPLLATFIGNNWDNSNKDTLVNLLITKGGKIHFWTFDFVNIHINYTECLKSSNYSNFEILKYLF